MTFFHGRFRFHRKNDANKMAFFVNVRATNIIKLNDFLSDFLIKNLKNVYFPFLIFLKNTK
jgi:hypothetical protein